MWYPTPTMSGSTYDRDTLAAYFRPLSVEFLSDPAMANLVRQFETMDPDVIAAIADVDRSLIRQALAQTPTERLQTMEQLANLLAKARRGG
jgi:hypothetical protein